MGKVLRVFIVLLLVLSIASLVLGFLLFKQREVVKKRTQNLENGLIAVATEITAPREPHIRAIDQKVDAQALMKVEEMGGQIELIRRLAQTRRDQHFQEGEDHVATKGKLSQTEAELFTTRQRLADTEASLARAREENNRLQNTLAEREGQIRRLESEVADLKTTVDGLKQDLAKKDDELQNKEIEIRALKDTIARYENDPTRAAGAVRQGLTGEIIVVNDEWNFVVLNIGSEDTLVPSAEMLVHRGDELIGKVRVLTVTEKLAIADILRDWQKRPFREGDSVLF